MNQNSNLLDLIIIGAAAAGPAAAVYAARRRLNFVVLCKELGGEVALSGEVENWPGTIHTTGIELAKQFIAHMNSYNTPVEEGIFVENIKQEGNIQVVTGKSGEEKKEWRAKTVIIATGIHPREIGIPGEKEFRGKGVTYCTVCDGPLFKNKVTATIGAGNAGLESALMMAELASKVYLLTKFPNTKETQGGFPKGEIILIEKAKASPKIEIIYNANTKEITGNGLVGGLVYEDTITKEEKTLAVNGVMVHVGMLPNSNFAGEVQKDPAGQIIINNKCETSIPGLFAAGDVTNVPYNQIAIATGHGVTSALAAIEYINKWVD